MFHEPTTDSDKTTIARPQRKVVDKVRRYNWKMEHQPGKCQVVSKHAIKVDHRYQRSLNETKRLEIAANFNWVAFGAISVNRRGDGSLWAVDGQHRLAAAKSREDVDQVPCVIFEIPDSIEEEAAAFLALNTLRRTLTSKEKFRAQIIGGDEIALIADELMRVAGRSIASSAVGTGIDCLTALMSIIREDADNARRVWPLIVDLCHGERIDNRLVYAVAYLERRMIDTDGVRHSLLERENKKKLVEAGVSRIMQSIGEAAAFYHRGGHVVFAKGVLNIVNYRRRMRLMIKGHSDE